jgi:ribosome-associated toxin RatA of RatAB toxin-antitoxin module
VIAAAGMSKSFTTRNLHQINKMIEIRLVDGPFSHLEGFWRFDEVEEGSKISFDLEFEFAGKMLSMLLGPVFEQVTDKMVDAFCARAETLYG